MKHALKRLVKNLCDRTLIPFVRYVIRETKEKRERTTVDIVIENALVDSAAYAESRMKDALYFWTRQELWDFALSETKSDGLVAEFGVFKDLSINYFAKKLRTTVYGFDSFEGLQEDWMGHETRKGHFSLRGQLPEVERNVELVQGWFDQTVPVFLENHSANFSFIHIDCDTYQPTRTVFELLGGRLQKGTVIVFDEYFGFRGWRLGEYKAWKEFSEASQVRYDYIGFGPVQVAIKIR